VFEIGNSLHEARIRQGLDFPEVELSTKIRVKYIRALEQEEFSLLPGETYVRGFLRTYADYLGLDGQLYVDEYVSRYVPEHRQDDAASEHVQRPRRRRDRGVERKAVVLALLGIAVLAALVIVAWRYGGSNSSTPSLVQNHDRKPAATASGLVLHGVGRGTYVEVRRRSSSGQVLLQATVPHGGTEQLTGSRFYLFVRRPAGVRVTLGGKAVSLPARRNLKVVVTPSRTVRVSG
jgi:cytoskeleton protein RodZ